MNKIHVGGLHLLGFFLLGYRSLLLSVLHWITSLVIGQTMTYREMSSSRDTTRNVTLRFKACCIVGHLIKVTYFLDNKM